MLTKHYTLVGAADSGKSFANSDRESQCKIASCEVLCAVREIGAFFLDKSKLSWNFWIFRAFWGQKGAKKNGAGKNLESATAPTRKIPPVTWPSPPTARRPIAHWPTLLAGRGGGLRRKITSDAENDVNKEEMKPIRTVAKMTREAGWRNNFSNNSSSNFYVRRLRRGGLSQRNGNQGHETLC